MSDAPQDRMVSFGESFPLAMKNYVNFNGRSSRGAYWWYVVVTLLLSIVVTLLDYMIFPGITKAADGSGPLSAILSLGLLLPGLAIGIRRLHDIGRSGWWTLIVFTIIGILLLIYWAAQPGQRGDNQYGPDREAGR